MSVLKKLAGETALYGLSSILGRSISFVLVFLYTAIFQPGQTAIQIKLYAVIGLLQIIYTVGLDASYFRFSFRERDKQQDYYNLTMSAMLVTSLILSGLLVLFAKPLIAFLNYPGQEQFLVWTAGILALDAVMYIPFARLRLEKRVKKFVFARVASIVINVGLNFFFLLVCPGIAAGKYLLFLQPLIADFYDPTIGIGYVFIANLIASAATYVLLWREVVQFRFRWDWAVLRRMLDYGYPIMLMGLAGSVNLLTDRLVLERFLPEGFYPGRTAEDALGIYGNCYKLSIFMSLAIQAFRYAADPFFFSRTDDKNAPKVFADVMHWFIIACVLIWIGVSLNLDFIGTFFRKEIYREGLGVVPILLLGNLFLGVYYNLSVWFKLTDKTGYGTLITGIGAVSTLVLNILLIPVLGYTGSALAFLASCALMAVICYVLGEKYFPVPYSLVSAVGYIGSAGLLIYLSSLVQIPNLWLAVPFHLLLFLLYFVCIVVVERNTLLPKRWRKPTLATASPTTSTAEKGTDPASAVGEGSFEDEVIH